jgi:hypothetical protein
VAAVVAAVLTLVTLEVMAYQEIDNLAKYICQPDKVYIV